MKLYQYNLKTKEVSEAVQLDTLNGRPYREGYKILKGGFTLYKDGQAIGHIIQGMKGKFGKWPACVLPYGEELKFCITMHKTDIYQIVDEEGCKHFVFESFLEFEHE